MEGRIYSFDHETGVGYLRPFVDQPGALSHRLSERASENQLLMFDVGHSSEVGLAAGLTVEYSGIVENGGAWDVADKVRLKAALEESTEPMPEWERHQWDMS